MAIQAVAVRAVTIQESDYNLVYIATALALCAPSCSAEALSLLASEVPIQLPPDLFLTTVLFLTTASAHADGERRGAGSDRR